MKLIKNFTYQFVMFNLMVFINKFMLIYIDVIYLVSLWSMICIWILSESFIISQDLKNLEDKYNLLLSDYFTKINLMYHQICKNKTPDSIVSSTSTDIISPLIVPSDICKLNFSKSCVF